MVLISAELLAALAAALLLPLSGLLEVSNGVPHGPAVRWMLRTTLESSVRRRARQVETPQRELLEAPELLQKGAAAFDAMCAGCHGAPGREPASLAEGLFPRPPDLTEAASAWSEAELFWIIKHGIRMTGMPGFGPTHDDTDIWQLVALVSRLPALSADAYGALVERGGAHGEHLH